MIVRKYIPRFIILVVLTAILLAAGTFRLMYWGTYGKFDIYAIYTVYMQGAIEYFIAMLLVLVVLIYLARRFLFELWKMFGSEKIKEGGFSHGKSSLYILTLWLFLVNVLMITASHMQNIDIALILGLASAALFLLWWVYRLLNISTKIHKLSFIKSLIVVTLTPIVLLTSFYFLWGIAYVFLLICI